MESPQSVEKARQKSVLRSGKGSSRQVCCEDYKDGRGVLIMVTDLREVPGVLE